MAGGHTSICMYIQSLRQGKARQLRLKTTPLFPKRKRRAALGTDTLPTEPLSILLSILQQWVLTYPYSNGYLHIPLLLSIHLLMDHFYSPLCAMVLGHFDSEEGSRMKTELFETICNILQSAFQEQRPSNSSRTQRLLHTLSRATPEVVGVCTHTVHIHIVECTCP